MRNKSILTQIAGVAAMTSLLTVIAGAAFADKPSKNDITDKRKDVKHAQAGYKDRHDESIKKFDTRENDRIGNAKKDWSMDHKEFKQQTDAWKAQQHGKLTSAQIEQIRREKQNEHHAMGKEIDRAKVDETNYKRARDRQYKETRGRLKRDFHNYEKNGNGH